MRILVTNDDGIHSPGLKVAESIALGVVERMGGGEVYTVAPATERSGFGHSISYGSPAHCVDLGNNRFAVDGTPADCVIIAVSSLLHQAPDLVLSGVNYGRNVAEDVLYSGTIGGAMQGAVQGVRSIALSQLYNRCYSEDGEIGRIINPEGLWDLAYARGDELVYTLICDREIWSSGSFYSINFPCVDKISHDINKVPVSFAYQGMRPGCCFKAVEQTSPNGKSVYWMVHASDGIDSDTMSSDIPADYVGLEEGNIVITPMNTAFTDYQMLKKIEFRDFRV